MDQGESLNGKFEVNNAFSLTSYLQFASLCFIIEHYSEGSTLIKLCVHLITGKGVVKVRLWVDIIFWLTTVYLAVSTMEVSSKCLALCSWTRLCSRSSSNIYFAVCRIQHQPDYWIRVKETKKTADRKRSFNFLLQKYFVLKSL